MPLSNERHARLAKATRLLHAIDRILVAGGVDPISKPALALAMVNAQHAHDWWERVRVLAGVLPPSDPAARPWGVSHDTRDAVRELYRERAEMPLGPVLESEPAAEPLPKPVAMRAPAPRVRRGARRPSVPPVSLPVEEAQRAVAGADLLDAVTGRMTSEQRQRALKEQQAANREKVLAYLLAQFDKGRRGPEVVKEATDKLLRGEL